jgi:hypothetical protein
VINAGMDGPTQVNTSTATASAQNSNQTAQVAGQTQQGGGSQTQVVRQDAPVSQSATAAATAASETRELADGVAAGAETVKADPRRAAASRRDGWELAPAAGIDGTAWSSAGRPNGSGGGAGTQPQRSPDPAPRDPRSPLPQDSSALGAPPGAPAGGSLWVFAALLIPFALTAPWWARRERLSVVRRLTGLVLRLERPC